MYRNGTYVAFDGQGETDPTRSDIRYFNIMKAWKNNDNLPFNFTNSHEKTPAVRDTSSDDWKKARICERLQNSKNMVIILTENTRKRGSLLSYEIEKAVDTYKLPLILVYPDEDQIYRLTDSMIATWPDALRDRSQVHKVHICFREYDLRRCINMYSVVSGDYPPFVNTIL